MKVLGTRVLQHWMEYDTKDGIVEDIALDALDRMAERCKLVVGKDNALKQLIGAWNGYAMNMEDKLVTDERSLEFISRRFFAMVNFENDLDLNGALVPHNFEAEDTKCC